MGRMIVSIIAAFLTASALSISADLFFHSVGLFPPIGKPFFDTNMLMLALGYRALFQVLAGYVGGLVANKKAMKAAWSIGIIGTLIWLVGSFTNPDLPPAWFGITGAVLSIPTFLLGAKLYLIRLAKLQQFSQGL